MENIVKKLIKKKLKISFAESCTGGMLAASITSINGASKIFNIGLITYSNKAKINILKVNKNIIKKYGAVCAGLYVVLSLICLMVLKTFFI